MFNNWSVTGVIKPHLLYLDRCHSTGSERAVKDTHTALPSDTTDCSLEIDKGLWREMNLVVAKQMVVSIAIHLLLFNNFHLFHYIPFSD